MKLLGKGYLWRKKMGKCFEEIICGDCRCFSKIGGIYSDEGYCQRFPPVSRKLSSPQDQRSYGSFHPIVDVGDWCGEFKEKEDD